MREKLSHFKFFDKQILFFNVTQLNRTEPLFSVCYWVFFPQSFGKYISKPKIYIVVLSVSLPPLPFYLTLLLSFTNALNVFFINEKLNEWMANTMTKFVNSQSFSQLVNGKLIFIERAIVNRVCRKKWKKTRNKLFTISWLKQL